MEAWPGESSQLQCWSHYSHPVPVRTNLNAIPHLDPCPVLFSIPFSEDPISYTTLPSLPSHYIFSTLPLCATLTSSSRRPRIHTQTLIHTHAHLYTYTTVRLSSPVIHRPASPYAILFRSRAKSVCGPSVQRTTAKFSYLRQLPTYSKLHRLHQRCHRYFLYNIKIHNIHSRVFE